MMLSCILIDAFFCQCGKTTIQKYSRQRTVLLFGVDAMALLNLRHKKDNISSLVQFPILTNLFFLVNQNYALQPL